MTTKGKEIKEIERRLNLEANMLSQVLIGRSVKVKLGEFEKPAPTAVNMETGEISIEYNTKDEEVLRGAMFHEIFHVLLTETPDYEKLGVPKDDQPLMHLQLNSLEDYRIEKIGGTVLYPASDYYIWWAARWWRQKGVHARPISSIADNPMMCLHYLLDNMDLTRFVADKGLRLEIRKIAKELKEKKFDELNSTAELFPLARDAYYRLKPWLPEGKQDAANMADDMIDAMISGCSVKKKPLIPDASKAGSVADTSPKTPKTPDEALKAMTEKKAEKRAETEGSLKTISDSPKYTSEKQERDYARPYTPEVKVFHSPLEGEAPIKLDMNMVIDGRRVGRELMQRLKLENRSQPYTEEGDLDMDSVFQGVMEGKGTLRRKDIFTTEIPLIRKHTVLILIDFSGSMGGSRETRARNAALMIGSALDEMSVPYAVRGFGAKCGSLLIADFVLKDFGRPLDLDKLARHNSGEYMENRDSDSLRRAVEVIKGESGKKIIFVISDGQPEHPDGVSDYRAYNKQSDMDMIHAIREAEAMDISVIGVGITSAAAEFISTAYTKGFYIQKLEELPEKLIDIYLKETEALRANLFHKLH